MQKTTAHKSVVFYILFIVLNHNITVFLFNQKSKIETRVPKLWDELAKQSLIAKSSAFSSWQPETTHCSK